MPLSTLQETPRDVPSKTRGQDGFATSFPVGVLHPLQHAGLSRRSPVGRHPTVDSFADFPPRLRSHCTTSDAPLRLAAARAEYPSCPLRRSAAPRPTSYSPTARLPPSD